MSLHTAEVREAAKATDTSSATVTRGSESWTYLYVVLGFALAIEGTLIQMVEPLKWPRNFALYVALIALTTWLFLFTRFRVTLFWMRTKYESIPD
jgi:hypothetical protein